MGLIASYSNNVLQPAQQPRDAVTEVIKLAAGSYSKGQLVGEITATPGTWGAYAAANTDGTQVPKMVLKYPYVANADGTVNPGNSAAGEWGQTEYGAIAYRSGAFLTTDLVGLDANAVPLLGKLVRGTVASGLLVITGE